MQFFDHVFFVLMSIAAPLLVYRSARNAQPPTMTRSRNYLRNVVAWLAAPVVLLYKWIALDRPLEDLGLAAGVVDATWLAGISVATAFVGFMVATRMQWGQKYLFAAAVSRNSLHTPRMPRGPEELGNFTLLELAETASDELIYRAFIGFYLYTFLGTAAAFTLMIVIYVGSEAYRGRAGMTRAAVLGLVNSTLLFFSGAIWAGVAVQLGWRTARMAAVINSWKRDAAARLHEQ